ncbi:MAG TPA: beta-ketoacyl synthase N-terminal-like domain-containing protein, partial [Ktedonobacteraceae bacterium]|nr:beta-ketoacyl synthase N-terminal-like domain-containing protein [Ktedonobacteraceae bacterium]
MDYDIKALMEQIQQKKMGVEEAAEQLRLLSTRQQFPTGQHMHIATSSPPPDGPVDGKWLRAKTTTYLKQLLSSEIELGEERIEGDDLLEKYGIDSIVILRLTDRLERDFGPLSKTLFFEYPTIQALAAYFFKTHKEQLLALFTPQGEKSLANGTNKRSEPGQVWTGSPEYSQVASPASEKSGPSLKKSPAALDIAIVGLAGRYPGAQNIQQFWENLRTGKDCISEIPADRWNHSLYFDQEKNTPGKTYTKWGGFLDGVEQFDPLFFAISPQEAEGLDPQERLFLECAYEALEDAGYTRSTRDNDEEANRIGVYVGVMYEEYQLYGAQEQVKGRSLVLGGNSSSIANRVSYFCNFRGPSITLNTMCSSSLTAIHLACQSLQSGECEAAIAGGVNLSLHPNKYLLLGQGKFASSRGRCESFGEGGDGYVPGEGVGAVILKPLARAVADRDHIYGVIKGIAINHGGKTNGYTVPNPRAQSDVISQALENAGIVPQAVSYIEAHGTGTSLGDPIEIAGMTRAFSAYTQARQYCAIGSVKSNIGHCESAAGIASLTKVLLQMKYRQIVPSLHASPLNPHIDFASTPFKVQQNLASWGRPVWEDDDGLHEYPRIAGISSFGAGGSNVHVLVEEYIAQDTDAPAVSLSPSLIVLSARNEDRLKARARQLIVALEQRIFVRGDLASIAYTLQVGREAMNERLAFTAESLEELREKLQAFVDGKCEDMLVYRGRVKRGGGELDALVEEDVFQAQLTTWIRSGAYGQLMDLWVRGLSFDWNRLYGSVKPRRVSLPTYPFARKRYWAPSRDVAKPGQVLSVEEKWHPLVQEEWAAEEGVAY